MVTLEGRIGVDDGQRAGEHLRNEVDVLLLLVGAEEPSE